MTPIVIGRKATQSDPLRLAVLISGTGSNMEAIIHETQSGRLPAKVEIVISDRPDAPGLEKARSLGVEAMEFPGSFTTSVSSVSKEERDRRLEAYHEMLVTAVESANVEIVVLAGYMRILPKWVVDRFPDRIVNIHPSLLPSFPGLKPHRQALDHGVKVSGCTVHLVDYGVDQGPIIMQEAVMVHDDDTEDSLAERVLAVEHRLYPAAIKQMTTGRLTLRGRRCTIE